MRQIRAGIESSASSQRHDLGVVPAELAYTASETLPLFRRESLLDPVRPKPEVLAEAYYGADYATTSPDVHVLPLDGNVLCLLEPGRGVFLSDGVTHHYAMVDAVDYQRQVVTLLDPWAPVSFLLPGHNVIGVKARPHVGAAGQPLLDLTFDEFLRALHGSLEAIAPQQMFATMEKLDPALGGSEDYLAWKYSRLLASDDFTTSLMISLELSGRPGLAAMPKLRLLQQWSDDYTIGVPSSFSIPAAGRAAKKSEIPELRQAFLRRLDDYARVLPWPLKWLLLRRTDEIDDTPLRMAIVDSFLRADPADTDFQIARAETLLREDRPRDALAQLDDAGAQWTRDVSAAIAKTPASAAVGFLFARDYGLDSLSVLHWRHMRIQLLRRTAQVRLDPASGADHDAAMEQLQGEYVIGSVLIDFFPEVLRLAFLSGKSASEDGYIQLLSGLPDNEDRRLHLATALYGQFATVQSIRDISQPTLVALRRSPISPELCSIVSDGRILPGMSPRLQDDLGSFCKGRTSWSRP